MLRTLATRIPATAHAVPSGSAQGGCSHSVGGPILEVVRSTMNGHSPVESERGGALKCPQPADVAHDALLSDLQAKRLAPSRLSARPTTRRKGDVDCETVKSLGTRAPLVYPWATSPVSECYPPSRNGRIAWTNSAGTE